ncbi:MAG: DUF3408 domain-containing protein [Muribaculaceae bacterium]|nr:DUF3408 domain-containing protein [Muribaculaceae bacterium]
MTTTDTPTTFVSQSTQLADATANPVLTLNPSSSMTKDNSINPTPAVNSNECVDTINTPTSDNLFNDEQTTPETSMPPKQQRIGKQQRKSDFADFKETYLMPSKLTKRHSVNIEESVWEQLERIARILGDRGSNVGSYINAILSEHLKIYASDIEVWRKL